MLVAFNKPYGLLCPFIDRSLAHRLTDPRHKQLKTYWVQVEGEPGDAQLDALRRGVELNDGLTRPVLAIPIDAPVLWPRNPPVRFRKTVPDRWLEIVISEGRNPSGASDDSGGRPADVAAGACGDRCTPHRCSCTGHMAGAGHIAARGLVWRRVGAARPPQSGVEWR